MEGHPFRFISLCGRVFIELNPRCYEKLVPKGLVLALGIKTRSIDVLLESSALHQKIVHQATQMLSSDWSFNSFHAAGTNRRPDFSLSWGFDLSSTNKSAIPLRHSLFPRHSVFSFVFFLPQLSGTFGRNRLFYPPTLSGYNWSLHNYFSLGTTQLISWPDRERYSCTPQSLVVSLLLSRSSTLIFSRAGDQRSHLNSLTSRFPLFSLNNLCSVVTLPMPSFIWATTDTTFHYSYLSRIGRIENLSSSACGSYCLRHLTSRSALSSYALFVPLALWQLSVSLRFLVQAQGCCQALGAP